jgi:hypothetical protein
MRRLLIWLFALSAAAFPFSNGEAREEGVAAGEVYPDPPAFSSTTEETDDLKDLRHQIQTLQQKVEDLERETEARKILRLSEEEESREETELLTAVGREYALIPKSALGLEYGLVYHYFSTDILQDLRTSEGGRLAVERRGNHTFTNSLFTEYGLLQNLSLNMNLPFVYKYDKRSREGNREVTDLGDISLGLQYQPFKSDDTWPSVIVVLNGVVPSGRSPYKINPDRELATGSGYFSAGAGLALSKTLDPVVAFGSVRYSYPFPTSDTRRAQPDERVLDEVAAGDTIGFTMGLAFAISYKTSINFAYQYAYHNASRYHFNDGTTVDSNSWVTSSFSIGAGWRLSPRFSLYTKVDIGLTNDDPDFSFSIRIPVRFHLGG